MAATGCTCSRSHWQPGVLRPEVQRHHLPIRRRPDALAAVQYRRRATEALRSHGPMAHGAFSALSPLGGVFWVPSVHRVAYELALRHRGAAGGLVQRANPYHRLRLRLEREILSPGGYSHLLAAADQVKVDVVERYGVPEADVTVQPLGFDPRAFSPARRRGHRAEARAELGYGDEDRVVVFVANELERKGFDCLLEAAARAGRPARAGGRPGRHRALPRADRAARAEGQGGRERQRRRRLPRRGRRLRAADALRAVGARRWSRRWRPGCRSSPRGSRAPR